MSWITLYKIFTLVNIYIYNFHEYINILCINLVISFSLPLKVIPRDELYNHGISK